MDTTPHRISTSHTDPLGRTVLLREDTWSGHILKRHPDLSAGRGLVIGALERPREIRVSGSDPRCRMYFGTGPRPTVEIVVVADVADAIGFVKTAFLVKNRTAGAIEWP